MHNKIFPHKDSSVSISIVYPPFMKNNIIGALAHYPALSLGPHWVIIFNLLIIPNSLKWTQSLQRSSVLKMPIVSILGISQIPSGEIQNSCTAWIYNRSSLAIHNSFDDRSSIEDREARNKLRVLNCSGRSTYRRAHPTNIFLLGIFQYLKLIIYLFSCFFSLLPITCKQLS